MGIIIIQICSGITRGRVLNGELYAQRLQQLIYLHLSKDCFMKISFQSTGQICSTISRYGLYTLLLHPSLLTLTVLVATTDAQWEGMGDVG